MFHTILAITYLVPGIYLFIRIWHLFVTRKYRLLYVVVFFFLSLLSLGGIFVDDSGRGFFAVLINTASGYLLPFFLYVFLCVLLLDIFLIINLVIKVIPSKTLKSQSFRRTGLTAIMIIAFGVTVAGIINFNTIRVSDYEITIPRKSSSLTSLKIAFVSDFHLKKGIGVWFVEKFVKKVHEINPDIILFGGDIIEGHSESGSMEQFESLISSVRPKYGSYGVLGNHEHYAGQDKGSFFTKSGIVILSDTIKRIDKAFTLAGRNDSHAGSRKSIGELLAGQNDSLPVILIDHRPQEYDQISKTLTDIVLSGHTHNGQLFPINFTTRRMYPLSYGHMQAGRTHFFVSSGIRLWGPPVRTVGKSEILVVNINLKNSLDQ
jgi:predicted MPP superfamily phosphohydrolase